MAAVPLYLTGGVVITAAFREYTGFWIAAAASVAVCTFTKALSVYALHQALGAVRNASFCQLCIIGDADRGSADLRRDHRNG
jgi:hypothetical protein